VQLNVCERWTEQRWFRSREHQQQRVYTMSIGVGRWHDGQNFVLQGDPRHFRLMELWQGHQHEQKLDALVFEPEPVKYVLPPVPVRNDARASSGPNSAVIAHDARSPRSAFICRFGVSSSVTVRNLATSR